MRTLRTYEELMSIPSFVERFRYLKLAGDVGESTFGFDRYLNQKFYRTEEWKQLRNHIIVRDRGFDLGAEDRPIGGRIYIHHMNPIDARDILRRSEYLLNPDYLICCSFNTHNAIHYGSEDLLQEDYIERQPNDTIPWR